MELAGLAFDVPTEFLVSVAVGIAAPPVAVVDFPDVVVALTTGQRGV
jgi:hypothetical protein